MNVFRTADSVNSITTKEFLKSMGLPTLQLILAIAFLSLALMGCQPVDEKVSTRGNFGGGDGTFVDLTFGDKGLEYARSSMIELADVSRQVEGVLAKAAAKTQPPTPPVQPTEPVVEVAAAVEPRGCRSVQDFESPEGTLEFQMTASKCKETGPTFIGDQSGRELAFATYKLVEGKAVVTAMKIEGKGIENFLKLVKNDKDTLDTTTFRFLDVKLQSEENGQRLYRFWYESVSNYSLNLKSFLDDGTVTSKLGGVLVVEIATGKVIEYRPVQGGDRADITVKSARRGRSGTFVGRQEFRGSGTFAADSKVALDSANCVFPEGEMQSRFTTRKLGGAPPPDGRTRYIIDSKAKFTVGADAVMNPEKPQGAPLSKVEAKLCTADQWITTTEFFAGLLF